MCVVEGKIAVVPGLEIASPIDAYRLCRIERISISSIFTANLCFQ